MAYTTVDDPTQHFNTVLYTGDIVDGDGTGHDQSITGIGFQPDWLWHKGRSHARQHIWVDSVRGTGGSPTQMLGISSQDANAEVSANTNGFIESIDSDGFTVTSGNDSSSKSNNAGANTNTYVAWGWKAGTTISSTSTSGSGTAKTYTGSVSTTAGFSIIRYVGNQTAGHTIPHHLGAKPDAILVKHLGDGQQWATQWSPLGATKVMRFATTNAVSDSNTRWNDTEPTTSVFTLGTEHEGNTNDGNHIAYCFTSIKGYSKIGSYTGNGNANGTFVHTGFKPAWLIVKQTDTAGEGWYMWDNKRSSSGGSNENDRYLIASVGNAEGTLGVDCDFLSNGFKHYYTGDASNGAGHSYIYMAFAESPFVNSNGVPTNAR